MVERKNWFYVEKSENQQLEIAARCDHRIGLARIDLLPQLLAIVNMLRHPPDRGGSAKLHSGISGLSA